MPEKKTTRSWLESLLDLEPKHPPIEDKEGTVVLRPALRQIGITNCPICKHEVAVFLTKTNRPFLNCSFCSVRIFYNGREAMRRLKRKMELVEDGLKL